MINAALLYKTSAAISFISVPGHILLGLGKVHPVLNTIPAADKSKKQLAGKRSAQACFNYVNGALAVAGLLNLQWARTGGPTSLEEKVIFWIMVGNGFIDGLTYISAEEYGPLGCMWVAPLCSVLAYTLF